jgi:hypothetical protein
MHKSMKNKAVVVVVFFFLLCFFRIFLKSA